MSYDIAAYIWPSYTGDEPRTRIFWPEGYGEWETVKAAHPKFEGHKWPRRPLWGYVNEADPYVMQMQIESAVDYGVNVFIYDWYWYDGRPFLEQCLNNGFLGAKNNGKMKFYLMWANHDVLNLWDRRISNYEDNVIWQAAAGREEFEKIAVRLIENYFKRDNYYKIGGKPVFEIYDSLNLIKGLGGLEQTKAALGWFNEEAVRRGLNGVHFQMTLWNENAFNVSGLDGGKNANAYGILKALGYESVTHYQFCHFANINMDYLDILTQVKEEWNDIEKKADVPYFPHISLGWDNNPRHKMFRPGITTGNTPENIKQGLLLAKNYADSHPDQPPLITINSWNEWTESSYLQPDDINGYGYLQAVKEVFFCK